MVPWVGSPARRAAFVGTEHALTHAPVLPMPDWDGTFAIHECAGWHCVACTHATVLLSRIPGIASTAACIFTVVARYPLLPLRDPVSPILDRIRSRHVAAPSAAFARLVQEADFSRWGGVPPPRPLISSPHMWCSRGTDRTTSSAIAMSACPQWIFRRTESKSTILCILRLRSTAPEHAQARAPVDHRNGVRLALTKQ